MRMRLLYRIPLLGVHFFFATLLGVALSALRPFRPSNSRMCAQIYAWPALWLTGMRVKHIDTDNFPTDRPFVAVSNHQSNWDLVVVGSIVPERTVSIGKKSLRWVPLFGQLYWLAGNVLIDRKNRNTAIDTLSQTKQALHDRRTNIWIFPEGTRNRGNNMLPFKKGAFVMAIEAGVPIVPVCCSAYLKGFSLRKRDNGEARIAVLPPMETSGLEVQGVDALIDRCQQAMQSRIESFEAS